MRNSSTALFAAILLASASLASAQTAAPAPTRSYYYWLHPKLGLVKVDRATNAMIVRSDSRKDGQVRSDGTPRKN